LTRNEFDDGVIVHEISYDDTNDKTFASEPTSSRRKIDKESGSFFSGFHPCNQSKYIAHKHVRRNACTA
jgi:hypothetical protein